MKIKLEEYLREDGASPYRTWFNGLDAQAAAKGNRSGCVIARGIQGKEESPHNNQEREESMTLTRDFKQTVVERVERDPDFAKALLDEAATLFLSGEPDAARLILRDLVNATVGFESLAELTHKPSKSLHRMLSPKGNPSMDNLAAIFGVIRNWLKVTVDVRVKAII